VRNWPKKIIIFSLILILTIIGPVMNSFAAIPAKPDPIRVLLMADTGKGVNPYVTINSASGYSINLLQNSVQVKYLDIPQNKDVRFKIDQYQILLLETDNVQSAYELSDTMKKNNLYVEVTSIIRNNVKYYQVWSGTEATEAEAKELSNTILSRINKSGKIYGPNYLLINNFSQETEADNVLQNLLDKGYFAYKVAIKNNNILNYQVWVGKSANTTELEQLKNSLITSYPNIENIDLTLPALIFGQGVSFNNTTPVFEDSLAILFQQKLQITPKAVTNGVALLKVKEKNNRTYRGQLELTVYGNSSDIKLKKLALINQLPLEEYLYGVVGIEMGSSFPLEALKVQAVTARTYAVRSGTKYAIAHISDTTYDQAYYGYSVESDIVRRAVNETKNQVLTYNGDLVSTLYSANAGGITADGSEVWGNQVAYLKPINSPDNILEKNMPIWYKVVTLDGNVGYIKGDLVTKLEEKHPLGYQFGFVNADQVNLRRGPNTGFNSLGLLSLNLTVLILSEVKENNSYSWQSQPYTGTELKTIFNEKLKDSLAFTSDIETLTVNKRGPSGRAVEVAANGKTISVPYPDYYRYIFDVRSTLFTVEEAGKFVIKGAQASKTITDQRDHSLYILSANGNEPLRAVNYNQNQFMAIDRTNNLRIISKEPTFILYGKGYGHGLGMSQWGAKGLAEQGYNYLQILQHYYTKDAKITTLQ